MYNVILFTDVSSNIASLPAIGAYKCAHVLRKHGYSCLVVNHFNEFTQQDLDELFKKNIGEETFLIGFSTSFLLDTQIEKDPTKPTPSFTELKGDIFCPQGKEFETQLTKLIKNHNPNIKIVVGGTKVHPNYNNQNIDYACIGYSEISVVNLANHICKGTELPNCKKNVWGACVIDDRLAPSYKFADEDMIWLPTDVVNHQCLPIEVGRGCVFKCKFCSYPLNGKETLDFVKRADILAEELQRNYELYGITNYQIVDDTFNDHTQKLTMIESVVKSLKFKPNFWSYARLDLLNTRPETIETLYNIGLRSLMFGIETLHPKAGRAIGKGYDFKKSVKTIEHIRKTYPEITMHGSFIAGLPYESINHIKDTFSRLKSQDIPLHSWQYYPMIILEPDLMSFNSDISLNYQKYGFKKIGNITPRIINWESEYTSWKEVVELTSSFQQQSYGLDVFKLEGTLIFQLSTMGLNIDHLIPTTWKDFNFNYIEYQLRPKFISDYKNKLFELLSQ